MAGGMGMPRIPGGPGGIPMGGPAEPSMASILAMDNAKCVDCGNDKFIAMANIKMISPMMSPNGQWAHGVGQWWECIKCGKKFDPTEWVNNKHKMENAKDATPILVGPGAADK